MAVPTSIYATGRARPQVPTAPVSPSSAPTPAPERKARNFPSGNATAGRLVGDWFAGELTANQAIFANLRTMRNRIRQLARENDLARRYLALLRTKVVGARPIKYQATARMEKGGALVLDKPGNAMVEAAFEDFSRRKKFDVTGLLSRQAFECLVVTQLATDGEFLARKKYGPKYAHGFALQVLDPSILDETYSREPGNGQNEIIMGVEVDEDKRAVAYHFRSERESLAAPGLGLSVTRTRIPASEIIHAFLVERPGQTRGVPWMCSVGLRMKLLDGYEQAVVVGKRVAAAKVMLLTPGEGEEYEGDGEDAEGRRLMSAQPGEMEVLPKGMKPIEWSPTDMGETMAEFEKTIKQGIASGLCISYPALASDLQGVSYSSLRHGELTDRDFYALIQGMVIDQVNEDYIEDWMVMAMTTGALALPASKFQKFSARTWQPRQWDWVAPEKMMQAARMKYELGVSATTILTELGYDIDEQAELRESEPKTILFDKPMNYVPDPDLQGNPAPAGA